MQLKQVYKPNLSVRQKGEFISQVHGVFYVCVVEGEAEHRERYCQDKD